MYKIFIIWVCGGDVETRRVKTENEARATVLIAITEGAYSARYEPPLPTGDITSGL